MRLIILLCALTLLTFQNLKSQSAKSDSLKNLIEEAKTDTEKIRLTIIYAKEITYNNPDKAKRVLSENIKESKSINYKLGEAESLFAMAIPLALEGNLDLSIVNLIDASKIYQEIGHISGYAKCLGGLGNIYYYMDNYPKAQSYYEEALKLFRKQKDISGMASSIGNLGLICQQTNKHEKSLEYQFEGLKLEQEMKNTQGIATSHISISGVLISLKKYDEAKVHALKSIELSKQISDSVGIADGLIRLAECYRLMNQIDSAQVQIDKAIRIYEKIKGYEQLLIALDVQTNIYDSIGNYRNALKTSRKILALKDSMFNKEKSSQLIEMQTKFETERKEKENIILTSENYRQKLVLIGLIALVLFVIFFAVQIYLSRRRLKQAHINLLNLHQEVYQQKEEIETQAENLIRANEAIVAQKDHIESTHQKISDSIIYASFIQSAMLPSEELLNNVSKDYFILYKPRDVVSGDFYWLKEKNGETLLAVADCTGHGVPGALLSMMGISFLNDIVANTSVIKVSNILEELRQNVKQALGQFSNQSLRKEGIEIGLISYNPKTKIVSYSGAYLSLWLCRKGKPIEFKSDRMPIGISLKEKPFSSIEFKLEPDDVLYMFSDGYSDQIGGPNGKKLLRRNFIQHLSTISHLPLNEQKKQLEKVHQDWKGSKFDQIDDILVMGIKFN